MELVRVGHTWGNLLNYSKALCGLCVFKSLRTFDVHVPVHCVKFLVIKPTRCTNFSNLFLE